MAGILGIEYFLPDAILTNEELVAEYKTWTSEKISKKTGIESRHIAGKDETAVDLGCWAAKKLIESRIVDQNDIDFLVLITQSPDYLLPTSACILQNRLGLSKKCGALDINLGCSGFVYGLSVAKGLVDSGTARNVLLVTAETYSKHINRLDKSTRTIFGDAAAATLVGRKGMRIGAFDLGTDGSGSDLLKIPSGGARLARSPETAQEQIEAGNVRSQDDLFMDGTGVFEFSIREVPGSIERILEKEKLGKEQIDLFVFHQANRYLLDFLQRYLSIEKDKFYMNISDIGNTVSASIPIALKRAMDDGRLSGRQTILLCGFGVGLSWGSTILFKEDQS
jgi:3-oxoacyl-[acyl-carrier-protein] synthase-3